MTASSATCPAGQNPEIRVIFIVKVQPTGTSGLDVVEAVAREAWAHIVSAPMLTGSEK